MRSPNPKAERLRVRIGKYGTHDSDGNNGLFLPVVAGVQLKAIVSDGCGWDHVSVSLLKNPNRCPTWTEMCGVKELFFRDDETVVQFHPRKDRYVNTHKFVLHIWRKQDGGHELPPSWLVGTLPGQTLEQAVAAAEEVLDG